MNISQVSAVGALCVSLAATNTFAGNTRVLIWDERQPEQQQAYEHSLGEAIGEYLSKQQGFTVKNVNIDLPEQGLDAATLDDTDVLIWWGHRKHQELAPGRIEEVVKRVLAGKVGFIALHSSHFSRPFVRLMEDRAKQDATKGLAAAEKAAVHFEFLPSPPKGVAFVPAIEPTLTGIRLMRPSAGIASWREDGQPGHIQTVLPEHPIAKGLPKRWVIPRTEMYNEPFHVPEPDAVIFEESWEAGEHFRSGCVWNVGHGNVFYFRPGHETYPVFLQEENLRVIENAIVWTIDNR